MTRDEERAQRRENSLRLAGRPTVAPALNLPLKLDDGRVVLIKRGNGSMMVCRPKVAAGAPLTPFAVGDHVLTAAGRDGRKALLQVSKTTRKDVWFRIVGSVDGTASLTKPVDGPGPGVGRKLLESGGDGSIPGVCESPLDGIGEPEDLGPQGG